MAVGVFTSVSLSFSCNEQSLLEIITGQTNISKKGCKQILHRISDYGTRGVTTFRCVIASYR